MEKKRIAVLVSYDKDGMIDDYIPYMMRDLQECVERIVVVFNGSLQPNSRKKLLSLTPDVVERENRGYDAAAWCYAFDQYIGWDELVKYDELVLLNDSFYGPLYPFCEVFARMEDRDADFWGLSAHGEMPQVKMDNRYGYLPAHLQSYFLVVRSRMLKSDAFRKYWQEQKEFTSFREVIEQNEVVFTKYFADKGYRWASYIDTMTMDREETVNQYTYNIVEMLWRGYPVIKRKSLTDRDKIGMNNNEDCRLALEYIKKHSSYDVSLIWQNVLRYGNIGDIHDAMDMVRVYAEKYDEGRTPFDLGDKKAAVLLHITYMDTLHRHFKYLRAIPPYIDVFVTTVSEEAAQTLREAFAPQVRGKLTVLGVENRGRDSAALLIEGKKILKDYDYFCFCHDRMANGHSYSFGLYAERMLWENTLSSTAYIETILAQFEKDPLLGIMTVPIPVDSTTQGYEHNNWADACERTQQVLDQLSVREKAVETSAALTVGNGFWARTCALEKLFAYPWTRELFGEEPLDKKGAELNCAVERCYAFVAQDAGYYTQTVMTTKYAEIMTNALTNYIQMHPVFREGNGRIGVKRALKILVKNLHGFAGRLFRRVRGKLKR